MMPKFGNSRPDDFGQFNSLGAPGTSPLQKDLTSLIQEDQQFAQQMQPQNPDVIDQL